MEKTRKSRLCIPAGILLILSYIITLGSNIFLTYRSVNTSGTTDFFGFMRSYLLNAEVIIFLAAFMFLGILLIACQHKVITPIAITAIFFLECYVLGEQMNRIIALRTYALIPTAIPTLIAEVAWFLSGLFCFFYLADVSRFTGLRKIWHLPALIECLNIPVVLFSSIRFVLTAVKSGVDVLADVPNLIIASAAPFVTTALTAAAMFLMMRWFAYPYKK